MTGAEIKSMSESILDGDTIEEVFFYNVLNSVKNLIEDSRPWMFLRKLDTSANAIAGTAITLPTDWRMTWKLYVGQDQLYTQIPFDQQHLYRNEGRRFIVDVASGTYTLLGTIGNSANVYHYYIKTTDDVTASTSPVFPTRFHPILAYYVAGYIQMGVDSDDLFARMAPENKVQAQTLLSAMERWDSNLQLREQNGRLDMGDEVPVFNLGSL